MNTLLTGFFSLALLAASASVFANPSHGGLPPGLQKKVAQGQPLPPGWQRKLNLARGDYLPDYLYRDRRVVDLDRRHQQVAVEDKVYIVLRNTLEIVDILNL
ncbi:hypothetical protein [Marinobacter sp. SS21]|uniref:hypothetical protein n=1 Tax=Marinobacter sp. SS21 TaxID=2979460 RepID=UPI00232F14D8|nr:hypothetical protein [Marinobacter sp. SS21]MDC0662814.1 hypothetical protein [Marinobacter sp. SS21]